MISDADYLAQRDQFFKQAAQLAVAEKWNQALPLAVEALQVQQQHVGAEQPETLTILESIAVWQDRAADYTAAAATWAQLKQLSTKVRGEKHWVTINAGLFGEVCSRAAQLALADQGRLANATSLSFKADVQMAAGNYKEASEFARQSLNIRSALLGADNVVTAISMHTLGTALLVLGDCQGAQPLLESCTATREKYYGLKNPATLASLTSLAALDLKLGKSNEQREALGKLLTGDSGIYGPVHPITVSALYQLGCFELNQENLGDAETLLELAKTQRIKLYHGKHVEIAQTCKALGQLYLKKHDFDQAEQNLQTALRLYQELAGKTHPDAARAMVDLAVLQKVMRRPRDSIDNLRTAIDIFSTTLGNEAAETVDAMHVLATILPDVGDYSQAERLYRRVLQLYEKTLAEDDPRIGLVLMQLGTLYISWNDFGSAETYLRRSLAIYENTLGKSHPDTAGILSMLSQVDARFGRFEQAEQEGKAALQITEAALGKKHMQSVATSLALGNIYILENKIDDAQELLQNVLSQQPDSTGDDHYHNAIIREKLAGIALQKGRYENALSDSETNIKVFAELLPATHPHRLESLKIAAIANLALHRYDAARQQIDIALAIAREQLDAAAASQSERQQMALNFRLREILDLQLSLPTRQASAQQVYQNVLLWKGAVQARQTRQRKQLDPSDMPLAAELQKITTQYVTLSLNVPEGSQRKTWLAQLDALKQRKEALEAELAERSPIFKTERASAAITPEQLRSVLPTETVLVDVLEYVHFTGGHSTAAPDETRFVAFVVRHDQPVERVDLGPAQLINQLVESCRGSALFMSGKSDADALDQLSERIWSPLSSYVKGCHTILYSPDSSLARFPLAALPGEKPGTYLIEDFAIGLIPVPRMLAELVESGETQSSRGVSTTEQETDTPKMLIVGNVDYNTSAGQTENSEPGPLSKEDLGGELLSFEPLKSAPEEMAALHNQFDRRFPHGNLRVLQQADATEAAFRREAPENQLLFVATHGFFAAPNVSAALGVQDEMVGLDSAHGGNHSGALCGLALAGANQPLQADGDDGIFTAYEVSALDLRKVDLVVLSGCETGLGENTPGEGAISLQRAFQVAGAKSTVASLWSVPDKKTEELMQCFFHNLWDRKMSKLEALRSAQISLLHSADVQATGAGPPGKTRAEQEHAERDSADGKKPVSNPLPPYYWAAFVLSGDWQ
jgi:CHAT domain-containing protein